MDGIRLWYWLKVRYESAAKMYPIKLLYREKIYSLMREAGGSLVKYIHQFQVLEILWREIYQSVEPKFQLVIQMVEQIGGPIFYST